jgi:hypothetical protein
MMRGERELKAALMEKDSEKNFYPMQHSRNDELRSVKGYKPRDGFGTTIYYERGVLDKYLRRPRVHLEP